MSQAILEKRTSEAITYDIDCSADLATAEVISSVTSVAGDQAGLTFGAPIVNTQAVTYPDGVVAAIGKVVQVSISAGLIPTGSVLPDGRAGQQYTVRVKYVTNLNTREATVLLNVTNTPV